jgi:hypothetical protein
VRGVLNPDCGWGKDVSQMWLDTTALRPTATGDRNFSREFKVSRKWGVVSESASSKHSHVSIPFVLIGIDTGMETQELSRNHEPILAWSPGFSRWSALPAEAGTPYEQVHGEYASAPGIEPEAVLLSVAVTKRGLPQQVKLVMPSR